VSQPRAQNESRLLLYALLAFVLVIALGFAIGAGLTTDIDKAVLKAFALRKGSSSDAAISSALAITWLGDAGRRSLAVVVAALWLVWKKRPRAALPMLVFPIMAGVTSSILKEGFARPRPAIVPHLDLVTNLSFPSGHATNAIAILLLAALVIATKRRSLALAAALGVSLLVGLSRLALGVHWPSDVIGGWLWGVGWALLGLWAIRKLERAS
jgi:undecaprenyl-diphosphatase